MIVLTGPSAFKICQQLTEDSKNGEIQYVYTANSTPLLLYDALQSLGERELPNDQGMWKLVVGERVTILECLAWLFGGVRRGRGVEDNNSK